MRFIKASLSALFVIVFSFGCKTFDSAKMAEKIGHLEERIEALESENLDLRIAELEAKPYVPPRPATVGQDEAFDLPIGKSHILGKKSAPITVTIFCDYQCPYCAKAHPLLSDLVKDEELKGKVNVVMKHFPLSFHQMARPSAKAAMAAGEQGSEKFWAMSEKIFENQEELSQESFLNWAEEIGLDLAKFKKDLQHNDTKYELSMKKDTALGIKVANVRGTPSIYVGGWALIGERSVDAVKNLIREKELALD